MTTDLGKLSQSKAVSLSRNPASSRPGKSMKLRTEPVEIKNVFPSISSSPPLINFTFRWCESVNSAQPRRNLNLPSVSCSTRCFKNWETNSRFRSMIAAESKARCPALNPNSFARRNVKNRFADSIKVLLGMQPRRIQSPPTSFPPSMQTVFNPDRAAAAAAE